MVRVVSLNCAIVLRLYRFGFYKWASKAYGVN